MRRANGSKAAFWISFSAINDPETADYISKRCGDTTVEFDQLSRSSQMSASSRTIEATRRPPANQAAQSAAHAGRRTDHLHGGNPPPRCGRAIWF
ncbi:type IV secretory system conjugative DNA transfer family protein [Bradyrhizobium yuanmingense]|uniref:type IV secretory system conjugative DNA transfer family protein n=2 Tax=Bradyrhizobium TaxID=374 RepID=UPI003517460C